MQSAKVSVYKKEQVQQASRVARGVVSENNSERHLFTGRGKGTGVKAIEEVAIVSLKAIQLVTGIIFVAKDVSCQVVIGP